MNCPDGRSIGIVLIGRNEGARLAVALASIPPGVKSRVYVDSGSTDGSVARAEAAGARVVPLDPGQPFTAGRARNEGFQALIADHPVTYVQFIDGDTELIPGWIETATDFLDSHPRVAVVCGRRRERFPEASVYNRLCDREWDTPVGQTKACGGDAMMRAVAFDGVGGFNPRLIAGEEPELCLRLRQAGWEIWRIDQEMTLHDAAMTRFSQWWTRSRRAGYAAAEGAALHGTPPERHGIAATRRAVLWALALPFCTIAGAVLVSPWVLVLLLAWPAQILRLALRDGSGRGAWENAIFLVLGKFPEAVGVLEYHLRRRVRRPARLIEYK